LYIDESDFMEAPSKKFYRLSPGADVRLRHAYIITCDEVLKDESGEVVELRCTYDPKTKSGLSSSSRKVKGTIHWVEAEHALPAEVRLYDRLFTVANPDEAPEDFKHYLNPESVVVLEDALVEPSVADAPPETRYQFEREGYFWQDPVDSKPGALVFNRIASLRDTWAKISGEAQAAQAPTKPKEQKPKRTPQSEGKLSEPPQPEHDPVEALSPKAKERFLYYTRDLDLQVDDALILADQPDVAAFFEDALDVHDHPQAIANWIVNELLREIKDTPVEALPFGGRHLGRLVALIDDGTLSSRTAKDVFAEMMETGRDPQVIAEEKDLNQLSDKDALEEVVDQALTAYPDKVEQYRAGKTGLIGFFAGQVMRQTQGRANPALVQELLRGKLA
ncbi:MAG: glutamine--tRNA ligase/YqeY domain fusion protein, partial [Rhodothermales bacterium]